MRFQYVETCPVQGEVQNRTLSRRQTAEKMRALANDVELMEDIAGLSLSIIFTGSSDPLAVRITQIEEPAS